MNNLSLKTHGLCALMLLVLALPSPALAHSHRHEHYMDKLSQSLNLTATQKDQIKSILNSAHQNIKDATPAQKAEAKKMMKDWQAIKADTDQKINALLSDEQRQQYQTFQKEQRAKRKTQLHDAMLKRFSTKLSLTDDQKTKVSGILTAFQTKVDGLMAGGANLSDDQKAQIMTLRQERDTQMTALLSAEQKTKFAELKSKKDHRHHSRNQTTDKQ